MGCRNHLFIAKLYIQPAWDNASWTNRGETPDISEFSNFPFFEWVWHQDNAGSRENLIGKWLGVSSPVGVWSFIEDMMIFTSLWIHYLLEIVIQQLQNESAMQRSQTGHSITQVVRYYGHQKYKQKLHFHQKKANTLQLLLPTERSDLLWSYYRRWYVHVAMQFILTQSCIAGCLNTTVELLK